MAGVATGAGDGAAAGVTTRTIVGVDGGVWAGVVPCATGVAGSRGIARVLPDEAVGTSAAGDDEASDGGDEGTGVVVATGPVVGADAGELPAQATSVMQAAVNTPTAAIYRYVLSIILRFSTGVAAVYLNTRTALQLYTSYQGKGEKV